MESLPTPITPGEEASLGGACEDRLYQVKTSEAWVGTVGRWQGFSRPCVTLLLTGTGHRHVQAHDPLG